MSAHPALRHGAPGPLRNLQGAETGNVGFDATVEAFGNLLTVVRLAQQALVTRVSKEGNFGQNRRHVGTDQNYKRRLLETTIGLAVTVAGGSQLQRVVNLACKLA